MLKQLPPSCAFVLVLFLVSCSAIPVTPDPNEELERVQYSLVLANAGPEPIRLLPPVDAPGGDAIAVAIPPGQRHVLAVTLRLARNITSGAREVLLLPSSSSPLVTQSAIDLVVRAQFGAGSVRELRVTLGECVFDDEAGEGELVIELTTPPLPGIPVARLCPEPE